MQVSEILKLILACCQPRRVILYGEKVVAGSHNLKAADLCIIMDECDKKSLMRTLYLKVDVSIPVQFLLYSTDEWRELLEDAGSYASAIEKKGTVLYGKTP